MGYTQLASNYPIDIYNLDIILHTDDKNNVLNKFRKKFVDITPQPHIVRHWDDVDRWFDDPMSFYCNQYKFALHCATNLCGISKDQLTQGLSLSKAIYRFHVMYQTKKILKQMQVRMPQDNDFDSINNPYDKNAYERIKNEMELDTLPVAYIDQPSDGLGYEWADGNKQDIGYAISKGYMKRQTYKSTGKDYTEPNVGKTGGHDNFYNNKLGGEMFTDDASKKGVKLNQLGSYINEIKQVKFNYDRIVFDHNNHGLTPPGTVRVNDSIRAYVYALLGAQVQARQAADNSLIAQQQFVELVDQLINDYDMTLQDSIKKFEDALSKTSGVINYVIAKGLYMIPSNMILNKLGESIAGFNDKAVLAEGLVSEGYVTRSSPVVTSPKPKPTNIQPKIVSKPVNIQSKVVSKPAVSKPTAPVLTRIPRESSFVEQSETFDTHSGSKIAIIGGIVVGGIILKKFIL